MANEVRTTQEILAKLKIENLNPMQEEAGIAIVESPNVVLISQTGSGKTLAFLLPIMAALDEGHDKIQALILVPSRELAIQIEQVARNMGTGRKINAVYGGRSSAKDRMELTQMPSLLVGTPGRIADHIRRGFIDTSTIHTLVLDEFDKSLEVGFEEEMREIVGSLTGLQKRVLTSATQGVDIPNFVGLRDAQWVDYSDQTVERLEIKRVLSPQRDKLSTLAQLLQHIGNKRGIIFCNFKDSIQRVSEFLDEKKISHGSFYGGLEQRDRERALIKFRNETYNVLLATDLAARGIDVPEIEYIIHYHLPHREEEFIHRNGRTARMHHGGTAYVLHWTKEELPDFVQQYEVEELNKSTHLKQSEWCTLFISGGRKDKISKGDIAGLFYKQGNIQKDELGMIELKNDCAFVSVKKTIASDMVHKFNNTRLKKKKVRVREV